jgi:signal transduction histidine kinase
LISFNPKKFLLKPKISEAMQALLEAAVLKEIEIGYNLPEDLEVYGDENMIASTVRNLASNALKFTPKGGKINLSAKQINNHDIEISVRDTGIGMDEGIMNNLFHMDVFTNRQGTDGEPSSGLGLIICKDFVEKHGGKIWAESENEKGSTFHFTIPGNDLNTILIDKK